MGNKAIDDRLDTFKSNLNTLKSDNVLKYEDVKGKTDLIVKEIESVERNYSENEAIYDRFDKNLIFCEELIVYYTNLPSNYFNHWVGAYKVKGIN